MTVRFDLVADSGRFEFADLGWDKIRWDLLESQPAKKVTLVGDPPRRIRVVAHGDHAEVAPAVLSRIEKLAGTSLTIELLH